MSLQFQPRDLWVGLYVEPQKRAESETIAADIYICLVPCFPIIWRVRL